jgi:hypothetical protein
MWFCLLWLVWHEGRCQGTPNTRCTSVCSESGLRIMFHNEMKMTGQHGMFHESDASKVHGDGGATSFVGNEAPQI